MKIFLFCLLAGLVLSRGSVLDAHELTLDDLFPTDRVLDIQIRLPEEDWNRIRRQSREILSSLSAARKTAPVQSPYTYVEASVTIDGVEFPRVGLRKKGFLGSQSTSRPSLKVKLNHVDAAGGIEGLRNLTLNNNKQDASLMSQYLGYSLFNAVGSPAPRCAYAKVTVNGKDLGIYSFVESARKPLLTRGFGNADGVLFEGTVVDFCRGWEGAFEKKVGDEEVGRARIKELTSALSRHENEGEVLLEANAEKRAWVPTSEEFDKIWMAPEFDDSSWVRGRGAAGYDTERDYKRLLAKGFDFEKELFEKERTSIYVRVFFEVEDPSKFRGLTLRMKFDDGFVAFLNGHRVASANAPRGASWESLAIGTHRDSQAREFHSVPIEDHLDKLRVGKNLLAIHALNQKASSSDMLILPELRASATSSIDAIEKLVDLDAFYKFWAMEGLLGFWDGYSGNRNNFFVYLHPKNDKFYFMPWGADVLFQKYSQINRDRRVPVSVKTSGLLCFTLYQMPSGRKRYLETLNGFLGSVWNEEELLAEIERIENLLTPHVPEGSRRRRFSRGVERLRDFVRERRDDIVSETADGMPIWTVEPEEIFEVPAALGLVGRIAHAFGFGRIGDDDEKDNAEEKDVEEKDAEEKDVEAKDVDGDEEDESSKR